jgi:hypothetical protein
MDDVREFVASSVVANDRRPTNNNNAVARGDRGRIIGFVERQERR